MVFMVSEPKKEQIRDRVFSIQIGEKGTSTIFNADFLVTRDLFMKLSEKKVKELFTLEVQRLAKKIIDQNGSTLLFD